eukprot:m.94954 g.94954  ORF g.94954 m.94954 type:complete len:54 (-) comp8934_c0_seq11:158-319(-)
MKIKKLLSTTITTPVFPCMVVMKQHVRKCCVKIGWLCVININNNVDDFRSHRT